jgi:protein tyrosine/serine phosphatase
MVIWFIYIKIYGNFHKVDNNIYRSAQLYFFNMPYFLKKYKIKSIINLQNAENNFWYKDEIKYSKENNITHIDFPISANKKLSIKRMQHLINIIKNSSKPTLIHCFSGADRTSLAVALYLYNQKSKKPEKAFSILYGHFPWLGSKTKAMDDSFKFYIRSKNARDN